MTPCGIEILVKKASVDGAFRRHLLAERSGAAERIGLELDPAEAAMLDAIPEGQLIAIIEKTKVTPLLRPAFMGYAAAAMLAALVGGSVSVAAEDGEVLSSEVPSGGDGDIIISEIPERLLACGTGIRPDDDIPEGEIVGPTGEVTGEVLTIQSGGGGEVAYRSRDDIALKIRPIWKTIAIAYTNEANINGGGGGEIVVQFNITKDGKITNPEVISDSIGSSRLRNNILYSLKTVKLKPTSRDITVVYSFDLWLYLGG